MQRISQRTALTVIFGIAGRMDVPKKNAIIGFCRRNLLKRKRRLGAVRDALMEDISIASGYCLQKILLEIKQKKAVREKEGDCLAG